MSELDDAIAESNALGIHVWRTRTPDQIAGDRVRCSLGRDIETGHTYVTLYPDQTDAEALSALQVAQRRLLRFSDELWMVNTVEGQEPGTCGYLAEALLRDVGGQPMETLTEVRRTMGEDLPPALGSE